MRANVYFVRSVHINLFLNLIKTIKTKMIESASSTSSAAAATPIPRRITSKNVPRPTTVQQQVPEQQPVPEVKPQAPEPPKPTTVVPESPVVPPQPQPPKPLTVERSTINNTITWCADINKATKPVFAGDASTITSDVVDSLVSIKADSDRNKLCIKADGVYHLQAIASDQQVFIDVEFSKSDPLTIAKGVSFVNTTCSLKKDDIVSICVVPTKTEPVFVQQQQSFNPNLRSKLHAGTLLSQQGLPRDQTPLIARMSLTKL
jgi:hypothetical protein